MTSKTALPIARLRSLRCKVSTVVGHWPEARVKPIWHYSITLPEGVNPPFGAVTTTGVASARVNRHTGAVILYAEARQVDPDASPAEARAARDEAVEDVAGLLNSIADTLSKRGR